MTKFRVQMLAFGKPEEIREVYLPNEFADIRIDLKLERIFEYGQNEFQPMPHPSVSVGDVIEVDEDRWIVTANGFIKLSTDELNEYVAMEPKRRSLHAMMM